MYCSLSRELRACKYQVVTSFPFSPSPPPSLLSRYSHPLLLEPWTMWHIRWISVSSPFHFPSEATLPPRPRRLFILLGKTGYAMLPLWPALQFSSTRPDRCRPLPQTARASTSAMRSFTCCGVYWLHCTSTPCLIEDSHTFFEAAVTFLTYVFVEAPCR